MSARTNRLVLAGLLLIAMGGPPQAATADTEANKAVIGRWAELWNAGDLAIADEIFAEDFVPHVPGYPDINDRESYKASVAYYRGVIPDWHVEVDDMVAEGDKVAFRITCTGTLEHAPNYTDPQILMAHFAAGQIVEEWWNYDGVLTGAQMGMYVLEGRVDFTWGTPSAVTGDPGTPEANKDLVLSLMELWNTGNLAIAEEIFAPELVIHDLALPDVTGHETIQGQVTEMRNGFPEFRLTLEEMVVEGDRVAVRYAVTGTDLPESQSMSIVRVADGKTVEYWTAFNCVGLISAFPVLGASCLTETGLVGGARGSR